MDMEQNTRTHTTLFPRVISLPNLEATHASEQDAMDAESMTSLAEIEVYLSFDFLCQHLAVRQQEAVCQQS